MDNDNVVVLDGDAGEWAGATLHTDNEQLAASFREAVARWAQENNVKLDSN